MDYTVRKQGENQCVGFVASFIDDSFIPGGEQLLEPVAELVGELLCDPVTERGRFVSAYFESEKTNLIDAIRSQMNDKREYAYARLLGEMCDREPYGLGRMGDEESAERLQMKSSTPCTESCSPPPGWSCSTAAAPPWSGWRRPCPPPWPLCQGTASGTSPPARPIRPPAR